MKNSFDKFFSETFPYKFWNIKDTYVLEMINDFIACDRLNKNQILQIVKLVSISKDMDDLKENMNWESSLIKH